MNRDEVGFSYNLNPQFSTFREDLRIHPDGNSEGTLGCIGLTINVQSLIDFRTSVNNYLNNGRTFLPASINILNNPNHNGETNNTTHINEYDEYFNFKYNFHLFAN